MQQSITAHDLRERLEQGTQEVLVHRRVDLPDHEPHSADCWCSPLHLTAYEMMAPLGVLQERLNNFYCVH